MTNADIKKAFASGKDAAELKKMIDAAEKEYKAEQEKKKKDAERAALMQTKIKTARNRAIRAFGDYIQILTGEPLDSDNVKNLESYFADLEKLFEVGTREEKEKDYWDSFWSYLF